MRRDAATAGTRRPAVVRRSSRRVACLCGPALWVLVTGCVYYNGVYNAKHWASQAESSERDGRPLEAADRWRTAMVHADSVIARHPASRWAGDAWLIRGRAQVALERWSDADVSLQEALKRLKDVEQRREAQLALGRAEFGLGRVAEAIQALDSAVLARERRTRSAALLERGRARMLAGRPDGALEDFTASREPDAAVLRAQAALAMGDPQRAAALAEDAAAHAPAGEARWAELLDSLGAGGRAGPADRVVAVLLTRDDLPSALKARFVLGDAGRLLASGDTAAALARLAEARRLAPDSVESRAAAVTEARIAVAGATTPEALDQARQRLLQIVSLGGQPAGDAAALAATIAFADTLATAPGPRDAYWFLRGEVLRDSLGARFLAAATFADMAVRFPDSPWTPKGLLAAIVAGHPAADSLRTLLAARYPASPYTAIALSRDAAPGRYAALEDSLRVALEAVPGEPGDAERSLRRPPRTPLVPGARPLVGPGRPTSSPTIDP